LRYTPIEIKTERCQKGGNSLMDPDIKVQVEKLTKHYKDSLSISRLKDKPLLMFSFYYQP